MNCNTNLRNSLSKIHDELELIYAFVIKLQEDISRELVSREFNFKTSQSLIAAAQCYESIVILEVAKSHRNFQLGSLLMQILFNLERRNRTLDLRRNPLQNLIMLVIFNINLNQVNFAIFLSYLSICSSNKSKSQGGGDPANQICFHFNRNVTSACELPHNLCRYRRQHKCLTCQ